MPRTALVVIDMLNPYEHEDADALVRSVERIVAPLAEAIAATVADDEATLVYVNDNHGDFSASREQIVARACAGARPDLVEPFRPAPESDLLLKVRHSAFYATALEHLLHRRAVERVVLAGQVTEQCILYSALDAYVRHFDVRVLRDAVAHIHDDLAQAALRMMERNMRAELVAAADCLA